MDSFSIPVSSNTSVVPNVCRDSLWHTIRTYLPEVEAEEVRVAVGYDIIDKDLRLGEELSNLVDILTDLQQRSEKQLKVWKRKANAAGSGRDQGDWDRQVIERQIREMLKKVNKDGREILRRENTKLCLYFDIELKATAVHVDDDTAQNIKTEKSANVFMEHNTSPFAEEEKFDHQTDDSRILVESLLLSFDGKLDVFEIDHIVPTLRSVFREEETRHYKEIDLLRLRIEKENVKLELMNIKTDRPSMEELRIVRNKLEEAMRQKELFKRTARKKTLPVLKGSNGSTEKYMSTKTNSSQGAFQMETAVSIKDNVNETVSKVSEFNRGGKKMARLQELRKTSTLDENLDLDDLKHLM
mmetsp:Transcript_28162/g.41573  ORF Transcript_28162/g.41573 Transcript_28162/m.41573 type:complete len:356 (+) Transcript_28162:456-1523(+)